MFLIKKEIERKFLLNSLPNNLTINNSYLIEQLYISHKPEIRIRSKLHLMNKDSSYYLTFKSAGRLSRDELEVELDSYQYKQLKGSSISNTITKIRHILEYEENIVEIDEYILDLNGLLIAEVEFESVEEANSFIPPAFLGKEVTNDMSFKNKYIAFNGYTKEK